MNHSPFKNGILFSSGVIATFVVFSVGMAAWNASMSNVTSGSVLTATGWNAVVDNVNDLNTRVTGLIAAGSPWFSVSGGGIAYTGSKVGIGTSAPGSVFQVNAGTSPGFAGQIANNTPNNAYFSASDGTRVSFLWADTGSSEGMVGTFTNHNFSIRTNNTDRITVDTSGNVGIGTASPAAKLDVNGTVKATQLNSSKAPHILVYLSACTNGACSSYHALNTWVNVASYNYVWVTNVNNATDVFSHNDRGLITVLQPGTYRIRLSNIAIPSTTVSWVQLLCPYISGSADCLGVSSAYNHGYAITDYWKAMDTEFVTDLAANQTIGLGYQTYDPLKYWAHNGYMAIDVVKLN